MKIVIQRVQSASVAIEDSTVGTIKQGLLLLVGVGPEDTKEDLDYAVRKIINMRIFSDEDSKMNRSVKDMGKLHILSWLCINRSNALGCI